MTRAIQSGELFSGDLRAFEPRRTVIARIEDAAPSDRPCEWHPADHECVSKNAFWFRVNHMLLSLCRLHAKMMARKRGMEVVAVNEQIAA